MTETITIGGLTLEFLHSKDDTEGSLDAFRMTVQPGGRMPVPQFHESWDETVYGLDGTLTFTLDGQETTLPPGASLFIRRGTVHGFSNPSGAPATCLSILPPGVLGPSYFRELAALVATGAPDPARVKEIMLRHRLIPVPDAA